MGNKQNVKKKKSSTISIPNHSKLNKDILDTLGLDNNKESLLKFKEILKRKFKFNFNKHAKSNIGNIINDGKRIITTANDLIRNLFDSNINYEAYNDNLNNNFYTSFFMYDIIANTNEIFYKEKIDSLNSLLIKTEKEKNLEDYSPVKLTKSLEGGSISNLNSSLKINNNGDEAEIEDHGVYIETVGSLESDYSITKNRINNKIEKGNLNLNNTNKEDRKLNIFESLKIDNEYATPPQYPKNEIYNNNNNFSSDSKKSHNINNQNNVFKTSHSNFNKNISKPATQINFDDTKHTQIVLPIPDTTRPRSISKTKKRIYKKPPVVNIKINLKDFIRQDALEKSFLNETHNNNSRINSNTPKMRKEYLNMTNISKDQNISNINDSSFVDIVDVFSQTKSEYIDANKKKSASKSKKKINDEKLEKSIKEEYENNEEISNRRNRIKYKNSNNFDIGSFYASNPPVNGNERQNEIIGIDKRNKMIANLKIVNKN